MASVDGHKKYCMSQQLHRSDAVAFRNRAVPEIALAGCLLATRDTMLLYCGPETPLQRSPTFATGNLPYTCFIIPNVILFGNTRGKLWFKLVESTVLHSLLIRQRFLTRPDQPWLLPWESKATWEMRPSKYVVLQVPG